MNGLPYYKAYPRDFIEGTVGMPFDVKAAYRLLLDLIYMRAGNLPDDPRYIAGALGCSVRAWNKYRSALISAGKISIENGIISNFRADKELETLAKLQDKQRENRSRPNKNKELQSPRSDHTEPDTEPDTDIIKTGRASAPKDYAFEGRTIRLTQRDFDRWQKAYSAIPDLSAELAKADAFYTDNPVDDGKWFFPVSKWLERVHRDNSMKVRTARAEDEAIYRGVMY